MKKISLLVVALSFAIILAETGFAGDNKHFKVAKIVIDQSYHHIGDNYAESFIVQEPEGEYWESSFRVRDSLLKNYKIAYIKFPPQKLHILISHIVKELKPALSAINMYRRDQ